MIFEVEVRAKLRDPQITDQVQTHLEKYITFAQWKPNI